MRITKNPNDAMRNTKKIEANIGCHICPVCGETKPLTFEDDGTISGVSDGGSRFEITGFFITKIKRFNQYVCFTCGAEWESDGYYDE